MIQTIISVVNIQMKRENRTFSMKISIEICTKRNNVFKKIFENKWTSHIIHKISVSPGFLGPKHENNMLPKLTWNQEGQFSIRISIRLQKCSAWAFSYQYYTPILWNCLMHYDVVLLPYICPIEYDYKLQQFIIIQSCIKY